MAAYVRNICAEGEECQPLPGTYKEPECYILRSVNELEDPMPIKHKQGYLAICCISAGLSLIHIGQTSYLYVIRKYTAFDNIDFNAFFGTTDMIMGIPGGWWGAMVAVCAATAGIAAVVQPKSQKAFVLAACITSGIAMVLLVVTIVIEAYILSKGSRIAACVNTDYTNYGKSDSFDNAKYCMDTVKAASKDTNACFCVNGPGFSSYTGLCAQISQQKGSPFTGSNCSLPMSFNDRQLSSICVGAVVWAIVVCHFVYSIVILVEQPPVSIADDKGMVTKAINAPTPSVAEPSVPTLKV